MGLEAGCLEGFDEIGALFVEPRKAAMFWEGGIGRLGWFRESM